MKKLLLAALALALLLGAGCANGKANTASSSAAESAQGTEPEQENPLTESGALNFVFSSGAGGWSTQLTLQPDGTFTGRYEDMDLGDMGEKNPNGTVYLCDFSGSFSQPGKVDDHSWTMILEYLSTQKERERLPMKMGSSMSPPAPTVWSRFKRFGSICLGRRQRTCPKNFCPGPPLPLPGKCRMSCPFTGFTM